MADPASFRQLYQESEAESFGLSQEDFAQALSSGAGPFAQCLHVKDLALAMACSRGIGSAWECFAVRYGERLYAAAMKIAKDPTAARELADSVYGDLFNGRFSSYSGRGSLEGWLKAVLSQAYVDRYRSQRRMVSLDERLEAIHRTLFSDAPAPVDPRLGAAIREAFLSLGPEPRYLLAGYFFDQRTLLELGQTLGVHESTVSRRLNRLLQLLRRRIARILRSKGMTVRQVQESFETDVRDLEIDLRSQLVRE